MARPKKTTGKPLVSILIPSYNYAKYLPSAIKSALGQDYGNVEVIVVDGGSSDSSAEIAKQFPVKFIRLRPCGIAHAVDRAYRASKGEYLVILGADDLIHPDFVRKCLEKMRSHPDAAFVYSQTVGFGADFFFLQSMPYSVKNLLKVWFVPATFLMKRGAYAEAGGYDPSFMVIEDVDFLFSLAEKGMYGVLLSEPLYFYRQHKAGSRGMSHSMAFSNAGRLLKAKHKNLYDSNLSRADKAQMLAIGAGSQSFIHLRYAFSSCGWWPGFRRLSRGCLSILVGESAYGAGVPPASLKMIKKLDPGAF